MDGRRTGIRSIAAAAGLVAGGLLLAACGGGGGGAPAAETPPDDPPPVPPPEAEAPTLFVDVTPESGIAYSIGYRQVQRNTTASRIATGAAAAGDYDADGDVDLFITRGDLGGNLLFQNDGFGAFTDVAGEAGVAFTATATENYRHGGAAFADLDGDDDLDLFIGGLFGDPSFVFRNDGPDTSGTVRFTDVTAGSGIDALDRPFNLSPAFGDYDLDGDPDLFIAHWGSPVDFDDPGDTQNLWRNDSGAGGIRFTSVTVEAGLSPSLINLPDPRRLRDELDFTFAASFARIDDDLWPDLVVAADYNNSQVFLNRRDGTFANATDVNVIIDYNGMGSALGDYDDDGDLDWFVTAIGEDDGEPIGDIGTLGNRLYENGAGAEAGVFADVTDAAGVADGGWGWGACFLDLENDGDLDIFHTNGWDTRIFPEDTSRAFVSDGAGRFTDAAAELGLDDAEEGRGVVCADFDNDGDTDILLLHRGFPQAATMLRNDGDGNNYLRVGLRGRPPNTEASGARVFATVGGGTQMREIVLGSNFMSQNPTMQIFGLGDATQVDALRVEWPDGSESLLGPQAAGQTIEIEQP